MRSSRSGGLNLRIADAGAEEICETELIITQYYETTGMVKATQLTRGQRTRMMYVELKSGYGDNGPAWIGRVTFSKSGRSIFYRGRELIRISGGVSGNYMDVQTREEFWVSGVKRSGSNRDWAGSGPVQIDDDVRAEYEALVAK